MEKQNEFSEMTFRGRRYRVESRFSGSGTLREAYETFLIESQMKTDGSGETEERWDYETKL